MVELQGGSVSESMGPLSEWDGGVGPGRISEVEEGVEGDGDAEDESIVILPLGDEAVDAASARIA